MASNLEIAVERPIRRTNLRPSAITQANFERLCKTFAVAASTHPSETVESHYQLAGKVICVRIVGRSLAAIYQRAFAPRAFSPTAANAEVIPALTIELWDESVTDIPYPLPMVDVDGDHHTVGDGQVPSSDESGRWVWVERAGNVSWLDREANHLVGYRVDGSAITTHERSKPLVTLLTLWLFDQGIHILHAGMVARNGKGLLMTGSSGIGKSTTSLCCLLAGFDYLGDDHVALGRPKRESDAFVAHSVFQSARLLPKSLKQFPPLQPHAIASVDPKDPKALLFLGELFPEQVVDHVDISAIALPRFSGSATTSFSRATRTSALTYIAHNSISMAFGIGRSRLETIVKLLGSAPCYWLDLGHDLAGIPPAIDQLLAQAS